MCTPLMLLCGLLWRLQVTPAGYAHMTSLLMPLAKGRVVVGAGGRVVQPQTLLYCYRIHSYYLDYYRLYHPLTLDHRF